MAKDVNWYLSKGFSPEAAEYFASGKKKIIAVSANDDYTLTLTFDNGERRLYDVAPLLTAGSVFEVLKDLKAFKRVYLDDASCVSWDINPDADSKKVWSNKLDLCPDSCYIDSVPLEVKEAV